jgi:hypothetical protein
LLNNKAERNWKEQGVTRCTNELDGAEFFLWSHQSVNYSRICQHFTEHRGSLPCSQELSTIGPYPKPDESSPLHLIPLLYDRF